jgi:hypothetical protein
MKTKLFLLLAVFVLLFSVGWVSYGQKENSRWDYTVVHASGIADTQFQLNSLGAAGWQLVSVSEVPTGNPGQSLVTLYLKRAK